MNRFTVAVLCLGLMSVVQQAQAGRFGLFGNRGGGNCSSGNCSGTASGGNCSSGQCAVPLDVGQAEASTLVADRQVAPRAVEVDQGLQWDVSNERSSGVLALVRSYYSGSRRASGSRGGVIASRLR